MQALPQRIGGPMPLSRDDTVYQVLLELESHSRGAVHAVADEANASAGQSFDRGDTDVLSRATGLNLPLAECDEKDAAHRFSARFAAAIASLALV